MNQNNTKYSAIICAAGQGKRLGSMTAQCPKTLLEVGDKTILEYLLDNLSDCGLTDVLLVVGYKGEMIEQKIGNKYKRCQITYIYNKNYEITDNFYSIFLAREKIQDAMIFFNADTIFNLDVLARVLADVNENSFAIANVESRGAGKNPVRMKLDEQGKIIDFGHDLAESCKLEFLGIFKFSSEVTKRYFELADDFFKNGPCRGGFWFPLRQLVKELPFQTILAEDSQWVSVNDEEEYNNALDLVGAILK